MAPVHLGLLLVLHVSQFHILLLSGGWRKIQVAANHELVHEDSRDGPQEWGDDGHPPPVAARPEGQNMWLGEGETSREEASQGRLGRGSTHVKTSEPQPAMAVKRRGPKSRAGLTA